MKFAPQSFRLALFVTLAFAGYATAQPAVPRTFCNPLNINYGPGPNAGRHAADPVIVPFKDRYYLFTTFDLRGYRVSDDLVNWRPIRFDAAALPFVGPGGRSLAPAVVAHGDYVYYLAFTVKHGAVLRTSDPQTGTWEVFAKIDVDYGDPNLFFDDDGRLYLTYGLDGATGVELDPKTFQEIAGTKRELVKRVDDVNATPYGLHLFRSEIQGAHLKLHDEVDTAEFIGRQKSVPVQEGSWITKHGGKYYLQVASPGTGTAWYSDALWTADAPLGPYTLADYATASMKVGGFINGTGHSGVFADRFGNLWRVTSMWIGVLELFERRIGLFPVGFDAAGRMFTRTDFGDYPMRLPAARVDPAESPLAGWSVLSTGRTCRASSSLPDYPPQRAADENVRTWWSAETGRPDEWFEMDLGQPCDVHAVQVNFAESDIHHDGDDGDAYRLLASVDGKDWQVLVDRSQAKSTGPHDYTELSQAARVRYLKVENVRTPDHGRFALRDLRVFGNGGGRRPRAVSDLRVRRHAEDRRHVTFEWTPVDDAAGYLIRYGVAADALHLSLQIQGKDRHAVTVSALRRDTNYFYRVDAYNEDGITPGPVSGQAE